MQERNNILNLLSTAKTEWETHSKKKPYRLIIDEDKQGINFIIPTTNGGIRENSDHVKIETFLKWYHIYSKERKSGRNGTNRALYTNDGPLGSKARRATYALPLMEWIFEVNN